MVATSHDPARSLRARIEAQPVCVVSEVWSAGRLGQSVLYHYRRDGDLLQVGYFVYWSTERPWGNNALTYTGIPALLTDAFYSHFLFALPGARRILYGPGDVEGARVDYRIRPDGSLEVLGGLANDATHKQVKLTRSDLLDKSGRVVLMTKVWSHQLGAHGGAAYASRPGAAPRCFREGSLEPLSSRVAQALRLGTERAPLRAVPAWRLAPPPRRVASPHGHAHRS